jgi:hypothetical protein
MTKIQRQGGVPPPPVAPADGASSRVRPRSPDAASPSRTCHDLPPPRRARPSLSRPLEARFGCEIEVGGVRVTSVDGAPPPRRGTVLLERPLWNLETDNVGKGEVDLEVVFKPLSGRREVDAAMAEIVALFQRLREAALASEDRTVALHAIAPDAASDYRLAVEDTGLSATLQSTYGIGLEQLDDVVAEVLPRDAAAIRTATRAVEEGYVARHGAPLPPRARQFVSLVNLYLACAGKLKLGGATATAHAEFRMMTRSDFCAIRERLLDGEARAAVDTILATEEGERVPPFMRALRMDDPAAPVFPGGYNLKMAAQGRHPGPSVKDWLQSIVDGRGEGDFKKDLLSPPVGYPLHTGDLSEDYGMGAMGVDEERGKLLVEMRGAPYRPRNIPMNGQISRAVRGELGRAAALNPALEGPGASAARSAKFELLHRANEEFRSLRTTTHDVEARLARAGDRGLAYFARSVRNSLKRLAALGGAVSRRTRSPWAPDLRERIDKLHAAGEALLPAAEPGVPRAELERRLDDFRAELARFEDCVWEAGRRKPAD